MPSVKGWKLMGEEECIMRIGDHFTYTPTAPAMLTDPKMSTVNRRGAISEVDHSILSYSSQNAVLFTDAWGLRLRMAPTLKPTAVFGILYDANIGNVTENIFRLDFLPVTPSAYGM